MDPRLTSPQDFPPGEQPPPPILRLVKGGPDGDLAGVDSAEQRILDEARANMLPFVDRLDDPDGVLTESINQSKKLIETLVDKEDLDKLAEAQAQVAKYSVRYLNFGIGKRKLHKAEGVFAGLVEQLELKALENSDRLPGSISEAAVKKSLAITATFSGLSEDSDMLQDQHQKYRWFTDASRGKKLATTVSGGAVAGFTATSGTDIANIKTAIGASTAMAGLGLLGMGKRRNSVKKQMDYSFQRGQNHEFVSANRRTLLARVDNIRNASDDGGQTSTYELIQQARFEDSDQLDKLVEQRTSARRIDAVTVVGGVAIGSAIGVVVGNLFNRHFGGGGSVSSEAAVDIADNNQQIDTSPAVDQFGYPLENPDPANISQADFEQLRALEINGERVNWTPETKAHFLQYVS